MRADRRRGAGAVWLRRCAAMMLRCWPSRGMVGDGCMLARGGAAVLTRRCVAAVARSTPCVE